MNSIATRIVVFSMLGASAVACASPHTGGWVYDDGRFFRRVVLAENGTCVVVSGTIVGQLRDGIGARCRYSRAGDVISIAEVGEIGGTEPLEKLPSPMQFKLESGHLTALDGDREILVRVPK